jgi:hypothetical protein
MNIVVLSFATVVMAGASSAAFAITLTGTVIFNNSTIPKLFANANPGQSANITLEPVTLGLANAPAPTMRVGYGLVSSTAAFTELRSQVTMESWVGGAFGQPADNLEFYGHDLTPGAPPGGGGEPPYFFLTFTFSPGTFPVSATPEIYKQRIDSDPTVWNAVTTVEFQFNEGGPLQRFALVRFAVPEPSAALLAFANSSILVRRRRPRESRND